jgi:hypothetical protein
MNRYCPAALGAALAFSVPQIASALPPPLQILYIGVGPTSSPLQWTLDSSQTGGTLTLSSPGSAYVSVGKAHQPRTVLPAVPVEVTLSAHIPDGSLPVTSSLGGHYVSQSPVLGTFAIDYEGSSPLVLPNGTMNPGDELFGFTLAGGAFGLMNNPGDPAVIPLIYGTTYNSTGEFSSALFNNPHGDLLMFFSANATGLPAPKPNQGLASLSLPASLGVEVRGVPEPAGWTMILLGFGALGAALRGRGIKAAG